MGHRQRGEFLRAAVLAVCAVASFGAMPAWAQCSGGTGDAGNTCGAPGTAARVPQPRPERQQQAAPPVRSQPPPQVQAPRGGGGRPDGGRQDGGRQDRGDRGDRGADRSRGPAAAPAFVPNQQRPQNFDRGPGRGPDRVQDRGPDRGPDRDGPRGWNGPGRDVPPGRNFSPGPDRRPDFRPDYRPDYRPPPRFQGGPGPGYYAGPPPGRGFRSGPPQRGSNFYVYVDRRPFLVPPPRVRYFHDYPIVRPYGAWYQGYGRYRTDEDAYRWLGLTAITLGVLDLLDEGQQRTLEDAQIQATEVPVGTRLVWDDRGARGSVQVLSDGRDAAGRYCREFEQTVTAGGRTERAIGTACQDAEGIWEVVAPS